MPHAGAHLGAFDVTVLGFIVAGLAVAIVVCLLPLRRDTSEDGGDGRTSVVIPGYKRTEPHRPRTWAFLTTGAALGFLFIGLHSPNLPGLYTSGVRDLAVAITGQASLAAGYANRLLAATQFLGVAYVLSIALVVRASWGRRLVMLAHAGLYLIMAMLVEALMISVGIATGWPVGPFAIEATLANLLVGGLVVMRMTFTTFVLPRGTTIPKLRPMWWQDSLVTCFALLTAVAIVFACFALLADPSLADSPLQIFIPLYAVSVLFVLMFAPLRAVFALHRRRPSPGTSTEPVTVIVPAYNEEDNLARLLRSIDVAAGRHPGPVHVILSNDGSTDSTEWIANEEIDAFVHASGEILNGINTGQAGALNRGISIADTEVLVRIDADCVMGDDALAYGVPWFDDPLIGSVGAMITPRTDTVTWFHRLRTLETLFQFRFSRVGQSVVDGVVCIPGTFTAFRRTSALEAGGFPLGMNGEDCDLTMQIGRLGYRVVVDPRLVSFEDVPRTPGEFVEQRTRWARAGFHVMGRHIPFRAGSAGPRVWFWTVRRGFSWFSLQVGMIAPIFIAELALTQPTSRRTIASMALLYLVAGALTLAISLPLAVKHRQWRAILWMPTWFAYAFLRRLATLEAVISLPTRPVLTGGGDLDQGRIGRGPSGVMVEGKAPALALATDSMDNPRRQRFREGSRP